MKPVLVKIQLSQTSSNPHNSIRGQLAQLVDGVTIGGGGGGGSSPSFD
jgi:hypothetical protein